MTIPLMAKNHAQVGRQAAPCRPVEDRMRLDGMSAPGARVVSCRDMVALGPPPPTPPLVRETAAPTALGAAVLVAVTVVGSLALPVPGLAGPLAPQAPAPSAALPVDEEERPRSGPAPHLARILEERSVPTRIPSAPPAQAALTAPDPAPAQVPVTLAVLAESPAPDPAPARAPMAPVALSESPAPAPGAATLPDASPASPAPGGAAEVLHRQEAPPVQERPALPWVAPAAAVSLPGTSDVLDDGLAYRLSTPASSLTFGHRRVTGQFFDHQGNWRDTGTAVTDHQFAAMPAGQKAEFARRVGLPLERIRSGQAPLALLEPALGEARPGQVIDQAPSRRGGDAEAERNFGHDTVGGSLFDGPRWADTQTLVSADQIAAMGAAQRARFARLNGVEPGALKLGVAERVLVDPADAGVTPYDEVAARSPGRMVTVDGFRMTAETAAAFHRLKGLIQQKFPGRQVEITCTTEGRHSDPNHRMGRAIDFVVKPLSLKESKVVESLAWKAGFRPYNEYIHHSRFKTGPHMHVTLDRGR